MRILLWALPLLLVAPAAGQSLRTVTNKKQGFKVKETGDDTFVIDSASYARYDLVASVFASLDTEGTVALYRELKPLIDDAYAEISPPGRKFDDRLEKAFEDGEIVNGVINGRVKGGFTVELDLVSAFLPGSLAGI